MDDSLAAYDFFAPPLIRFGAGRIDEIGEMVGLWGRRAWIVGGTASLARSGAQQRIDASLSAAGIESRVVARSTGEPTVDQLAAALAGLQHENLDGVVVVAVGGGSTIDLAKALAALRMPTPIGVVGDIATGNGRAVFFSRASISAGVSGVATTLWISAAVAATCGADMDVPAW